MASRSLSDSKLPLAEMEIEEEIAKKEKRQLERSSAAMGHNDKRDSRTGEAIESKMCREHPERCAVRCLSCYQSVVYI